MEGASRVERPDVSVLGAVTARLGSEPVPLGGPKQRLVLALLAARLDHSVSVGRLIDDLWSDDAPATARKTLQGYVHHLRSALGDAIETTPAGYRLRADRIDLDAARFAEAVEQARRDSEADPATRSQRLLSALALWRGPAYADVDGSLALDPEITRLTELRMEAIELRIDADLAAGAAGELVGELESLTREYPIREKFWYQLMLALYRTGRQADALRAFERARDHLVEELGLDPSPALRRLEGQILEQDPALAASRLDREHDDPKAVRGYELRDVVGSGPLGVVHRAYQTAVGREVALKSMVGEIADRAEFVETFEDESRRVAGLDHPHILSISDAWREPGAAYHVTRWMTGGSLASRDSSLDPVHAVEILDQVGSALAHAHRRGVVHCRLKPTNVLFDSSGSARLVDFAVRGVAHRVGESDRHYLAPELQNGGRPTPQSDIYSYAVLAEALLGDFVADGLQQLLERAQDVDPETRPRRIEELIRSLRRAAGVDVAAAAATVPPHTKTDIRNPYKGLRAFQESDSKDFFGRDELVESLVEAVGRNRFVAVVGPSGSGKSSVVKAGLIPALRARRDDDDPSLLITEMFPGSHPFEELEAALLRVAVVRPDGLLDELTSDDRGLLRISKQILPDENAELLLIVDQFEELFSVVASEETRALFIDSLVTAVKDERSRISVVVTLRADFFDRPLEYTAFGKVMRAGLVTVSTPDEDNLARAIVGPAQSAGLEIDPAVVQEIVHDVTGQPGGLPLMQYALTEMFRQRSSDRLSIETYRATGGVLGALGSRAEDLYLSLGERGRRAIEQAFLRLVTVDEGSGDLRRRVRGTELASLPVDQKELEAAIRKFGAHRLLSFDRDPVTRGPTIEVAHEALLREWDRFRRWVDDQREDLLLQRQLSVAARDWETADRDRSYLLRGGRLEHFESWATSSGLTLTYSEQAYLDASREERRLQQERDARARSRLRGLLVAMTVLALIAVVAGLVANFQRVRADEKTEEALDASFAAETRRLVADAPGLVATNRQVAFLLAAEAFGRDPGAETLGALQQVLVQSHGWLGILGTDAIYDTAAFIPDGRLVGLSSTGLELFESTGQSRSIPLILPSAVAISADGSLAAAVSGGSSVVVVDLGSFTEITRFENESHVLSLAFSSATDVLAYGDFAGQVHVRDLASGASIGSFAAHPEDQAGGLDIPPHQPGFARIGVRSMAFSHDDTRLVTGGMVFARVWDWRAGELVGDYTITREAGVFGRAAAAVRDVDFVPGSADTILAATEFNVLRIPVSGVPEVGSPPPTVFDDIPFAGRAAMIVGGQVGDAAAEISGDLAALAVAGGRQLIVLDLTTGATVLEVDPQLPGSVDVAISSDGMRLAVASEVGIAMWALDGSGLIGRGIPRGTAAEGTISEDGRFVVLNEGGGDRGAIWQMDGARPTPVVVPEALQGHFLSTQYGDRVVAIRIEDTDPRTPVAVEVVPLLVPIDDLDQPPIPLAPTEALVFNWSANGDLIGFGGGVGDGTPVVNVFSLTDGSLVATVDELVDANFPDRVISSIGFDATAERMAAATSDGAMVMWDTTSWEPIAPLIGGGGQVVNVKFTPDGSRLATISEDGKVLLRDAASLQPDGAPLLGNTDGNSGFTIGPFFTDDGRYMITTTDGKGRLWDLEHRQQIGAAFPNDATGNGAGSMHGEYLLTFNGDHVTVWDLDVEAWFDIACQAVGRNLTLEEWEQFGPTGEYNATCDQWSAG